MPVKEKLNTPAMQAHKAASDAYQKAKEADATKPSATTKAAFEKASAHLKDATTALTRERFSRVATKRLNKALDAIRGLGETFNPRSYTYTKDQGEKAIKHLRDELDATEKKFQASLNPATAGKAKVTEAVTL